MAAWLLLLVIGAGVLIGAGMLFFLFKLGVIGYYALRGENDRGESGAYRLDQSRPPADSQD